MSHLFELFIDVALDALLLRSRIGWVGWLVVLGLAVLVWRLA